MRAIKETDIVGKRGKDSKKEEYENSEKAIETKMEN